MQSGAVITGSYRYLLWREWNIRSKTISFIMLNPSRADAQINDPTITRCINFAKLWGAQCVSIASRLTTRTLFKRSAPAGGAGHSPCCACALRRLEVVNLFAYRTPHPSLLKQAVEPIGKDNDRFILESVERSDRVILAWGNHGAWRKQDVYTLQLLKNYAHLYSLGITKKGCPRHPLYLRSTIKPQRYGIK